MHHGVIANPKEYIITNVCTDMKVEVDWNMSVNQLQDFGGIKHIAFKCQKVENKVTGIIEKTTAQTLNVFEKMMSGRQLYAEKKTARYT